jgi:hypothetical protein
MESGTEDKGAKPLPKELRSHFAPPLVLALLRVLFTVISAGFIGFYFYTLRNNPTAPLKYLMFWNWFGLLVYFGTASFYSVLYCINPASKVKLHTFHFNNLFSLANSFTWLSSTWYFAVEYGHGNVMGLDSFIAVILAHTVNLVIVIVDVMISRTPFEKLPVYLVGFMLFLYEFGVWVIHYAWNVPFPYEVHFINHRFTRTFSTLVVMLSSS